MVEMYPTTRTGVDNVCLVIITDCPHKQGHCGVQLRGRALKCKQYSVAEVTALIHGGHRCVFIEPFYNDLAALQPIIMEGRNYRFLNIYTLLCSLSLSVGSVQQKLRYGNRTGVMLPYLQWIVLFYHNNYLHTLHFPPGTKAWQLQYLAIPN